MSTHPLVKRFPKVVGRHRPVSRPTAPQRDMALVLGALAKAPFEPLETADLKFLFAMVALLSALTLVQRVSDSR